MNISIKSKISVDYIAMVANAVKEISIDEIHNAVELIWNVYQNGGTIYTCGNGGSAATASHLAGDMLKGLSAKNKKRFKSICLSDNQTNLLAISNDIDYKKVFSEPLENFASSNDLLIAFSGSGNSANILEAIDYANSINCPSIGVSGFIGGKLKEQAEHSIHANVNDMEAAEDCHLIICHTIKKELMDRLNIN